MDENDGKPDTLTAALYIMIFITYGYFIIWYFIISQTFYAYAQFLYLRLWIS